MNFGTQELLIILVIVMLLFGARRIPDLMKGFGEGIKSFKEGMRETPNAQSSAPAPPVDTAPPASEKKS
jgi:sec-independent protein translocase protein TatA